VSDYETTQRIRNITVGIFVIFGLCAFGWLIFQFGDLPTMFSKINAFDIHVQFASAPGIQVDTPVRFCGYQIGSVTGVSPPQIRKDQDTGRQYHQMAAVLSIDNKYKAIPSNVKIKLMVRGLGSSYIELFVDPTLSLTPRDPNKPETAFLQDGMLVQGYTGTTSDFFPEQTQRELDELIKSLNIMINNANRIIGDPNNRQNIRASLQNLKDTTYQATQPLEQLESFFAAATTTAGDLSKTIVKLQAILDKVNTGEGTLGRIVNDAKFYENLLENSQQLNLMLEELRELLKKLNKKGGKITVF
jgi:ABC-type transporter Mla subunit MlaD